MSDSDDDVPISALRNHELSGKRSFEDSSDDDIPIQQLAKKRAAERPAQEAADSDDDLPLADLKRKAAAKAKPKPTTKPKATPAKSKPATVTKKAATKPSPAAKKGDKSSKSKITSSAKGKITASKKKSRSREQEPGGGDKLVTRSSVLQETQKGEMVQKLLCRWWYAMEWPAREDVIPTPRSYVALAGYPGVYICVEGDNIGKLLDVRNKETCPCYANFSNKTSEELKQLLEMALIKQKEALVAHWGEGVEEELKIERELKWLKHVDPMKADRAAARALAHAKLDI